jgi:hypothetical protein
MLAERLQQRADSNARANRPQCVVCEATRAFVYQSRNDELDAL